MPNAPARNRADARHRLLPTRWGLTAVVVLSAVAVIGAIAIGNFWAAVPTTHANADDPAQVALGRKVYNEACASCHGKALEGQSDWRRRRANGRLPAPPHDETGHTWHHPDQQLFELTKWGPAELLGGNYRSDMPGFAGSLSDAQIWGVLAYIKSRWPKPIRERQAEITRRARSDRR